MDILSHGNDASSISGDNTPRNSHFTWRLSLLGSGDDCCSRRLFGHHLPGLVGLRWCDGLLSYFVNLLSLLGDAEGVSLGRYLRCLLVCFLVGLGEGVVDHYIILLGLQKFFGFGNR